MADRTHSHDTSTPAVSDETVPSEEFVLVPKEFLDFLRHAPVGSGTCCCGDDMQKHSNSEHSPVDMWDHELDQWLKQIATLPASHLAKEGGEAGAAAPPAKLAHRIVLHCQNTPPEEAIEIAERLIVTALNHPMNVPQPSPALAKGGDAVRAAAQAVIDSATNTYRKRNGQMGTIEGEDGEMSWIVPFDPFEELRAALSTPTEGPASQTEGMGGDAARFAEGCCSASTPCAHQKRDKTTICAVCAAANALTPPETAEAVPVAWRWRMAADRVWNYQEDRQRIPDAIHEALHAHPDPEAERDRFRPLQQALAVFDKPDEFMTDDKAWFQALGVINAARTVIANFPGELEEASRG